MFRSFFFCLFTQGTDNREQFSPTLNKYWRAPIVNTCNNHHRLGGGGGTEQTSPHDSKNIYVTEIATSRRKNSDNAEVESMSLSGSTTFKRPAIATTVIILLLVQKMLANVFVIT